ncbi:MAG: hypothetical protein QOH46_3137 [Solirubrobacteraceae bacterium]|jgi:hypothetical protein|nr:hypothetical protein [Solirubrobacteraceae bacterium]
MGVSAPKTADGLDQAILLSVLSDLKNGDFDAGRAADAVG